jgi:nitrogen fixation-related uncharacterized protein
MNAILAQLLILVPSIVAGVVGLYAAGRLLWEMGYKEGQHDGYIKGVQEGHNQAVLYNHTPLWKKIKQ